MDEARRRFGDRLRALRREAGLTQEALAEAAHLHSTHVANMERGRTWPSLAAVLQLSRALKVPASALVAGIDEEGDAPKDAVEETVALLRVLSAEQVAFARDFLLWVRRRGGALP